MKKVPALIADTANILLLTSASSERQKLTRILSATGCKLYLASDVTEASQIVVKRVIDILVVDYDRQQEQCQSNGGQQLDDFLSQYAQMPASRWVNGKNHILLLSSWHKREERSRLLTLPFVSHVVAYHDHFSPEELIITVGKILRNDLFGLDKYLSYGATPVTYEVTSSHQKGPILRTFSEYATMLGINRRIISSATGVADEFLMNAIYDAPIHPDGMRPYARLPRTESVDLKEGESCFFSFAGDGRHLLLSMRDRFGSLTPDRIRSCLVRCFSMGADQIEQKQGGAGMGLYFIMESLNKMIVNISPGRGTEFIGIIDISGTYRDYVEQHKSFHIFVG